MISVRSPGCLKLSTCFFSSPGCWKMENTSKDDWSLDEWGTEFINLCKQTLPPWRVLWQTTAENSRSPRLQDLQAQVCLQRYNWSSTQGPLHTQLQVNKEKAWREGGWKLGLGRKWEWCVRYCPGVLTGWEQNIPESKRTCQVRRVSC